MYKFNKEMQNDVIQDWKGQEKKITGSLKRQGILKFRYRLLKTSETDHRCLLYIFMPRHKKWWGIMLYPPNFLVSVRPSVRPSISG